MPFHSLGGLYEAHLPVTASSQGEQNAGAMTAVLPTEDASFSLELT